MSVLMSSSLIVSCQDPANYPVIDPNPAVDQYFGFKIVDEYRNLEISDTVVNDWYTNQKGYFEDFMGRTKGREELRQAVLDEYEQQNFNMSYPNTSGNDLFYVKYDYSKNTEELVKRSGLEGTETILLSNTALNKPDSTFSINYLYPSFDGKYIAIGLGLNGSDNATIRVIEVETKEFIDEGIPGGHAGYPRWLPDNSGFLYVQLRDPMLAAGSEGYFEDKKVKLHILGTKPESDKLIFSRPVVTEPKLEKIDIPWIYTFENSDFVFLTVKNGAEDYGTLYTTTLQEVLSRAPNQIRWNRIFPKGKSIRYLRVRDKLIYALSLNERGQNEIIKVDHINDTKEVIYAAGEEAAIDDVRLSKNKIYLSITEAGEDRLTIIDLIDNSKINDVPTPGKLYDVSAYKNSDSVLIGLSTWKDVFKFYLYTPNTSEVIKTNLLPDYTRDSDKELVVEEIEVISHDNELVPLTLIYQKGVERDGSNPLIITAYGFYGISLYPFYDASLNPWFAKGGIYAYAHVRGGGEKGEKWYKDGFKATKANSWKDLLACVEYVIDKGYTSPSRLLATARSAGTITVGRAITEKPHLFRAAALNVGVLNTVRFENSGNSSNVPEFGTVTDSSEFKYVYDMDVYHHLKKDVNYPSLLLSANLNDERVEAWQISKVVAKLQSSKNQKNPILFNVKLIGGHFGGTTAEAAYDLSDEFSFFLSQIGDPEFKTSN